jgi:hypothetical protein
VARRWQVTQHASCLDKTPIGYDYVHSVIDDHSRFAYSEILPEVRCAIDSPQVADCGETKPLTAAFFLPIKACKAGHYGRCRECRNRRARERYHSTPDIQRAEIDRARRDNLRRRAAAA